MNQTSLEARNCRIYIIYAYYTKLSLNSSNCRIYEVFTVQADICCAQFLLSPNKYLLNTSIVQPKLLEKIDSTC